MLWGAGLACALGGAAAGTALGSTPILDRPALGVYYQSHDGAQIASGDARVLPDHYPLVTRAGTVPVEELSDRGLFSQARYRAIYGVGGYAPAQFAEAEYEPDAAPGPSDASLRIGDPASAPQQPAAAPAAPLDLAAGPANLTATGSAKTIHVATALAMR